MYVQTRSKLISVFHGSWPIYNGPQEIYTWFKAVQLSAGAYVCYRYCVHVSPPLPQLALSSCHYDAYIIVLARPLSLLRLIRRTVDLWAWVPPAGHVITYNIPQELVIMEKDGSYGANEWLG